MSIISKAQKICYQFGSYKCPYFFLKRFKKPGGGRSCCGGGSEDLVPMCMLTNTSCPGVSQCLRLDVKTKSELIKEWSNDIRINKTLDPSGLIR